MLNLNCLPCRALDNVRVTLFRDSGLPQPQNRESLRSNSFNFVCFSVFTGVGHAYFESCHGALQKLGLQFDPKFKSVKFESYLPGLIRASDAFEGEWKDRAVKATYVAGKKVH